LLDALRALGEESSLQERVAALKHDLGKYVAWTSANLEEDVWTGPVEAGLVDALRGDVLETRKHGGRVEAAWDVWDRLTADLNRPLEVPELAAVDEAVGSLRRAEPALRSRDLGAIGDLRGGIRDAQLLIRRQLSALHRRLVRG
jgi:hypothetical protein